MKRTRTWATALLLTLLCVLAAETNAQALDFPTLDIQYNPDSRSVIVTGVPMYDNTGTIQYSLDGSIRFGKETVGSFCYAPEVMPYHLPDQQGYIFKWDNAQFLLPGSGTYTFVARLTAHPRQNTGETLEKGPMQTITYEYWKDGEAPKIMINVKLDGDGGTYLDNQNRDCFNTTFPFEAGKTLASAGYTIDRITCVDKDFRGWIAYDDSGKALSGLLTTKEVLDYTIPDHNIRFVMQWDKREGYPVTAITYAAIINGTGEPDPNVRVTLENNGIRYSGYGCVTISKEVYSTWKGNVKVIWECPGRYIQANNRWIPDYFESEGSVNGFKKGKSCYISISATGKGKEVISPRDIINELFYSVRNTQPEISLAADSTVSAAGLPHTITALQLQSGSIYDQSMAAMKKATLTDNVLVYDITARNGKNVFVHQLDSTAEVTIQLPESYMIQSGSTALVYHLPGDGTAVPCDTTYDAKNRSLTFRTDHFSLYAVAEVAAAPEPPKQPDMPADPPTNPVQPDMPPVEPPAPKPPVEPGSVPTPPEGSAVIPTTPVEPPQPITPPDAPVNPTVPAVPPADAPVNPTAPATPPTDAPLIPTAPPVDISGQQPPTPISPATPEVPAKPIAPAEPEETASLPVGILAAAAAVIGVAAVVLLKKRRK